MGLGLCIIVLSFIVGLLVTLKLTSSSQKLPPGPFTIPFFGNIFWLIRSSRNFAALEPILRELREKHGPIITLKLGFRPAIFISSHELAHKALVQSGSALASRPPALEVSKALLSNQYSITTGVYGPLWKTLRQNFMGLFHSTKLSNYAAGMDWTLNNLKKELHSVAAKQEKPVQVFDLLQHSVFSLLLYMCFGTKLEQDQIRKIVHLQRLILSNFIRFSVLNFMPMVGKILFRKLWKELFDMRRALESVMLPIIKARQDMKANNSGRHSNGHAIGYIDSLLDLQVPGEGRKFTDGELVSLCSEFLSAGTDTSIAALQWAIANLVKHQHIQQTVVEEINAIVKPGEEITDEHLEKMHFLRAVVLETLRRHPPGHFILPRAAVEDTKLEGYDIPKHAILNFTVAEMSRDPRVWEDPMEFKPERFLTDDGQLVDFDLKGVREIKMMPFGAGRRVCPAIAMAINNQQYFVANLIREFKWTAEDGNDVDLSETQDFAIVMKNPLKAIITPRTQLC